MKLFNWDSTNLGGTVIGLIIAILFIALLAFIIGMLITWKTQRRRASRAIARYAPIPRAFPSSEVILEQIRLMRLETVRYQMSQRFVIETHPDSDGFWKWFVSESLSIAGWAEVIAGFDLTYLREDSIQQNGDIIKLTCDFYHITAKKVRHILAVTLGQKPVESKQALNEFAGHCGSDSNSCIISWQRVGMHEFMLKKQLRY